MATVSQFLGQSESSVSVERFACPTGNGIEAISALEATWPSLDFAAATEIVGREWGGPMASFGWALAAATALVGEQSPRVVTAIDGDGILRAIAPLARSGRWGAGRLEMLGVRRLNEPADFVFTDRASLDALIEGLLWLRRPLLLGRLPAKSPTIDAVRRACRGRAVVVVRPQASCPFIPLDESWLTPESHLSSRRRSDYRRALRRAERHGDVRAEVLIPDPEHLDGLLQIAFDIEARSWKGTAGTALACDPLRGGHLRQFADWASRAGTLRIALLWIGREPIAMQIATEEAGRWWLLKIGFDPAWSDCSPGTLLLAETLRHAVRQQLTSYEFLGTVENWTQVWTDHEHECVSVRVYPFGLRGAAALAADAFEIARRRFSQSRVCHWLRRSGIHENSEPPGNDDCVLTNPATTKA
jgi:CelD/BcsL family acetyltransferase involved in cellulose biosynthesis